MTRNVLPCGCIIRRYDAQEDQLIEMDVEWCEVHEQAQDATKEIERLRLQLRSAVRIAQEYYEALKEISKYDSPHWLRKNAEKKYGLSYDEALEMAYENIRRAARVFSGKVAPMRVYK